MYDVYIYIMCMKKNNITPSHLPTPPSRTAVSGSQDWFHLGGRTGQRPLAAGLLALRRHRRRRQRPQRPLARAAHWAPGRASDAGDDEG